MWGLGNISADSVPLRDIVLNKNGLSIVINAMGQSQNAALIRMGAWTLTNLMKGVPKPKYKQIKDAIPVLASTIMAGILN